MALSIVTNFFAGVLSVRSIAAAGKNKVGHLKLELQGTAHLKIADAFPDYRTLRITNQPKTI